MIVYTLSDELLLSLPDRAVLGALNPHPASNKVTIVTTLPSRESVNVRIFNSTGSLVSNQSLDATEAGIRHLSFDVTDLPAGMYNREVQHSSAKARRLFLVAR